MKRPTNNQELCHLWASQNVDRGKCGNMLFNGPKLYSYGEHYELARILNKKDAAGKIIVLTNGVSSTMTTESKHKPPMHRAVGHMRTFSVFESFDNLQLCADTMRDRFEGCFSSALRARTYVNSMCDWFIKFYNDYIDFCEIFSLKCDEIDDEIFEIIAELSKFGEAKDIELQKRKDEKKAIEIKKLKLRLVEDIPLWRNFTFNHLDSLKALDNPILRVRDNVVETSERASVPLDSALRLMELIHHRQAKKGDCIGRYTLDSYEANGTIKSITIGCHEILWSEVLAVLGPYQEERLKIRKLAGVYSESI